MSMKTAASSAWAAGGLYFKIGDPGYGVEIVCMLATAPGQASFRKIKLIRAAEPAPGASRVDLDAIFKRRAQKEKRAIPIPFAPPVTTTTLSASRMILAGCLACSRASNSRWRR
jgi:hypothetical protein